jgi:hypothetical protein
LIMSHAKTQRCQQIRLRPLRLGAFAGAFPIKQ